MRNRWSQFRQFQWINGPPISRRLSIHFDRFCIIFNQFQSVSTSVSLFHQFGSVWLGRKRRNLFTTGRWGKQHVTEGCKIGGFLSRKGKNGRSLPNDNKISDNKIRKMSRFYCHRISQEKQRLGTIFHKISASPTPSKTQILLILSFRRLWNGTNLVSTLLQT